jgi:hypothetical protein
MQANGTDQPDTQRGPSLYFFPDTPMTAGELRRLLADGSRERRAWAVSQMLRYADWDDIWSYVDREEVRTLWSDLDLPESLRAAWGRMLRVEPVTVR